MQEKEWINKNCTGVSTEWVNNIEYKFCTMKDGWIAIFEVTPSGLEAVIQAKDKEHALSYVSMIEPVTVPAEII